MTTKKTKPYKIKIVTIARNPLTGISGLYITNGKSLCFCFDVVIYNKYLFF